MRVVEKATLGRRMAGEYLVAREAEVDCDAVWLTTAPMVTCELDHDVARDDAIEEVLELFGTAIDVERERIGVREVPERELKRCLHGGSPCPLRCTNRARPPAS